MLIGHSMPEVTCISHLGTISVSHIKFALAPPSFAGSDRVGLFLLALRIAHYVLSLLSYQGLILLKMPPSKWGMLLSLYYRLL